ncbi:DUF3137 domain-containing protein [Chitinophaga sp. 22321]|uniref:DUF3137 domain-containing protein n=1 Tax=Chitinophaga hostae TaxID=2831022 RepID=A0ABS5JAZ2_9BACT|nr:DUF3137 domain-containing protein [Chitinophaga hostae]MBS0032389.1 DUF3137 domain-containing protein [Chitinophaga hostae]
MKTLEEFDAFLDQQLNNELQAMEQKRITGRNWMRRMWIASLLPFAVFIFFIIRFSTTPAAGGNQALMIAGMVLLFTLGGYAVRYFMMKQKGITAATDYQHDFKTRIVKPVIGFIDPSFIYQPINYASYEEFTESGLFAKKDYHITGNDQVYGKRGDLNFQCCDLTVTHMPSVTVRGQGPDTVFRGSYFIGQFPRYFHTPVYILSRSSTIGTLFSSSPADNGFIETWSLGKKVLPSDAAFNKQFMVYSPDVNEATQLLTPALMEQIIRLQERSAAKLFISFYNNRIYAGIGHGTDYFETTLNKSLEDRQMLRDYYLDFMSLLQLAEDLRGNMSIWTTHAFSRS